MGPVQLACRLNGMTRGQRVVAVLSLLLFACLSAAQQFQKSPPRPGYLLYLPKKTWSSKKKWPLILYLHGRSLRGNDLSRVTKYGLAKRLLTDKGFPFITICPQLADGQRWTDTRALAALVNDICRSYPVDRTRVYAMGFSMGASGVWRVAHDNPRMFSAVVSVGGIYEKPLASDRRMNSIPVWMIHGTVDTEASLKSAREVFDLLRKNGGTGQFTELVGKGHNIPDVFERSDLYHWLLKHHKASLLPAKKIRTRK
jgi:predicted peptidase